MDQTITALLGASIGAGGAVAAQVVSAIFVARREKGRLEWEKQQTTESRSIARSQLFIDEKRSAFVRVLTLSDQRYDALQEVWLNVEDRRQERLDEIAVTADTWWTAYNGAIAEVTLFAPDAEDAVREVMGILAEWEYTVLDEHDYDDGSDFHNRYTGVSRPALVDTLRGQLGLESSG